MSRIQLKERQFEPTGVNLGEFNSSELETFDLQYQDTDIEDEGSQGMDSKSKSHVPDPYDENPLKETNNSKSGSGSSSTKDENPSAQGSKDSTNTNHIK